MVKDLLKTVWQLEECFIQKKILSTVQQGSLLLKMTNPFLLSTYFCREVDQCFFSFIKALGGSTSLCNEHFFFKIMKQEVLFFPFLIGSQRDGLYC